MTKSSSTAAMISRRRFLGKGSLAASALSLSASQYSRLYAANDRLRIASIGTGGKGWSDLNNVAASPAVEVVGLCNIDSSAEHLGRAAERYPSARQYTDWRKLLDEAKDIDAVIVSTPDFMHAPIALPAMALGKHVYCQKPLTQTVFESRQMTKAAKRYNVVTQMGNQIQSHRVYRTAVKIVHEGIIGKVREVHAWQGGSPRWPRAIARPAGSDPVPKHVRWDLWHGVAEPRPYKTGMYHPFAWRGWQAYGTGQLGDFGCHILDPLFMALELTAPHSVKAEAPALKLETWTDAATVYYQFPGTSRTAEDSVRVTWYDAVGIQPPREKLADIPSETKLPKAGSVVVGTKGSLVIPHVGMPQLYPESNFADTVIPEMEGLDHYVQWADACRSIDKTTSNFDYAGPLAEAVLLGTVAIRFPGETLQWNSQSLEITNLAAAQPWISKEYRNGWEPTWIA